MNNKHDWYQIKTESHMADAYQRPHDPHCTIISSHHTQLFTHHRQIPTDRMPSHG